MGGLILLVIGKLMFDRPSSRRDRNALDGFGAMEAVRSSVPACFDSQASALRPLEGVQILTRYCGWEAPYWQDFLQHYSDQGARVFHVCVQDEKEADWVTAAGDRIHCETIVHLIEPGLDPGVAMKRLDMSQIKGAESFTLMVDADEYFHSFSGSVTIGLLFGIYPGARQISLPWIMCPEFAIGRTDPAAGFWGHIGKPVCRTKTVKGIVNDHQFRTSGRGPILPAGPHGVAVIHYWSRTFRDCLLKTFNNRFVDSKSGDLSHALATIRAGDLPIRIRLLAYLANQDAFLPVPSRPLRSFDMQLEEELLRRSLSARDEENCIEVFNEYRALLSKSISCYPRYPAVTLVELANLLPSCAELRAVAGNGAGGPARRRGAFAQ